jgi:hypothetical protein
MYDSHMSSADRQNADTVRSSPLAELSYFFHARLGHKDPGETADERFALQVKQQRLAAWKQLVKKYPAVDEDILYSTFKELGVCAAAVFNLRGPYSY